MNYALIENGIVTNIIWLYPGNAADFPNAVYCGEYPVAIGDTYTDGAFYRDGERLLTPVEQEREAAREAIAETEAAEAAYREGVQEA